MAVKFEFISGLICERVLREADGVSSAIRIVDIFFVPEDSAPQQVAFTVLVSLRSISAPPNTAVRLGVALIRPDGKRDRIQEPDEPVKLLSHANDPLMPSGVTIVMQMQVMPKNMGTYRLEIEVDGEAVTQVPFTLRRPDATEPKS